MEFVAAMLFALSNPDPVTLIPAPPGTDMAFIVATEEFVRSARRPNRLEAVMPPMEAQLIRMLGCRDACREVAQDLLHARGWDAARFLVWGAWMPDASISRLSEGLLNRLACVRCRGTGLCLACMGTGRPGGRAEWCDSCEYHWLPGGDDQGKWLYVCAKCRGSGLPRTREAWGRR